jgi:hypothetical protein
VTKPLFHFIREAVECRPQLRSQTWAINAIHELDPPPLFVTLTVNTHRQSKQAPSGRTE